jgi:hypothetical protein
MGKHHGDVGTRLYNVWCGIKRRCVYGDHGKWAKSYARKNVTMCDEWKYSYLSFKDWALQNGYRDDLQIDRIDNSKGYEPSNCRFVTAHENMMNRDKSIWVTFNGERTPLIDLCKSHGVPYQTGRYRFHKGMTAEQIIAR